MYGIIYKITNQLDGKTYVGQTVRTLEERFQEHAKADTYIGNAIRAHGVENFSCEVIEECDTREQLNEREIFWIAELNSKHPNGYNLTDGGGGGIPCDEVRAKLSAMRKGVPKSPEHIAKIVAARKGKKLKPHSPEHKAKISAAEKGEKAYWFGKHHANETCVKISATLRKESPYKKLLAEMDNHQLSYTALAKLLGLKRPAISKKMRGEYNFTAEQIAKLVEIFGKPVDYLLARD